MIGKVLFRFLGQTAEATLEDSGFWSCTLADVTPWLNALYRPHDYSPAHGQYGVHEIERVAARLKGDAIFEPAEDPPAEAVL